MSDIERELQEAQEALRGAQEVEAARKRAEREPQERIEAAQRQIAELQKQQKVQRTDELIAAYNDQLTNCASALQDFMDKLAPADAYMQAFDAESLRAILTAYNEQVKKADQMRFDMRRELGGVDNRFIAPPSPMNKIYQWFDEVKPGTPAALVRATTLTLIFGTDNTEFIDSWRTSVIERQRERLAKRGPR